MMGLFTVIWAIGFYAYVFLMASCWIVKPEISYIIYIDIFSTVNLIWLATIIIRGNCK